MPSIAFALCAGLIGGCAEPKSEVVPAGPVAQLLVEAADEAGVPRELLVAIAAEEGGLRLAPHRIYDAEDHVPVAGYLELRHGGYDSLARGAEIAGVEVGSLVEDTALGTRAGAEVVAELGRELGARSDDLASWGPALEKLSGLAEEHQRREYARRVLARIADGGTFRAYGGELVTLPKHEGLSLPGVVAQALNGTPQFPGAVWFDTSCTNKCNIGRGGKVVDTIVVHDTEGGWNASVATLQQDSGKSVHYIIDADGSRVGQFRSEDDITWHCGNSVYNGRSVGIEHVGYASDPDGFQPGLYATSVALVNSIRSRHTIPVDRQHIIGHYQVPDGGQIAASSAPCADPLLSCLSSPKYGGASNHRDPGSKWQWCPYMKALGGSCACNDAFSHFNCTTDKTQAVRCAGGTVEIRDCATPCQVQPIGEDDLCTVASTHTPRNPRAEASSALFHRSPVTTPTVTPMPVGDRPGDAPATPPETAQGGCSLATRTATSSAWGMALVLAWVIAIALSRHRLALVRR